MLNLPGLKQVSVVENPGQYEIEATVAGAPPSCFCLLPNLVKNGRRRSMFFDTPMHGRKVGIWVLRQRYKCTGCGKTHYERVPHMHSRHDMTTRLVEYIQKFGTERTLAIYLDGMVLLPEGQVTISVWEVYSLTRKFFHEFRVSLKNGRITDVVLSRTTEL